MLFNSLFIQIVVEPKTELAFQYVGRGNSGWIDILNLTRIIRYGDIWNSTD